MIGVTVDLDPCDVTQGYNALRSQSLINDWEIIKPRLDVPFNKTKVKYWQEKHNYKHNINKYGNNNKVSDYDLKPNFNTQ